MTEADEDALEELRISAQSASDTSDWTAASRLWMALSDAAAAAGNMYLSGRAAFNSGLHFTDLSDDDSAVLAYERALGTLEGGHWHHDAAICCAALGPVYRRLGRYRESVASLETAIDHFRQHGGRELADAESAMATTFEATWDLPRAIEFFDRSIETYASLRAAEDVARCEANSAAALVRLGRTAEAVVRMESAWAFQHAHGDERTREVSRSNRGSILAAAGRTEEGIAELTQARDALVRLGYPRDVAFAEQSLAAAYNKLGSGSDIEPLYAAHEHARAAVDNFRAAKNVLGVADAISNLGQVMLEGGQFELARQHLLDARATYQRLGLGMKTARIDHTLALLDHRVGLNTDNVLTKTLSRRLAADRAASAAVYIDALRLEIPSVDGRRAYAEASAAHSRQLAFVAAADAQDALLIADLICRFRSSGYPRASPVADQAALLSTVESVTDPAVVHETVVASAGVARLLGDERSVLPPPPWIRLPDGRLAVAAVMRLARTQYGDTRDVADDAYLLA